jgi:folylpolyglutamate synthase/dihydropteroate synthase
MTARVDLAGWLAWLEQLHPSAMELGLDRIGRVAARLGVDAPQVPVITVAGTNGKGSVCALAEAILGAGGYRVGCYTSPIWPASTSACVSPASQSAMPGCARPLAPWMARAATLA